MIETVKKIAEIWQALPVLPRRIVLFSMMAGFIAYISLRIAFIVDNIERLDQMTFWQFIGIR